MAGNQRQGARKFREYWMLQRGSEKGEDRQFWNSLLRDVLGVADVERHIQYQVSVPMAGTTKFLDAWIPETRVLIEHKSRGVKLDAPQAGHGNKTPFQQALDTLKAMNRLCVRLVFVFYAEDADIFPKWYKKATGLPSHCAFVSTNSICQGGAVASLRKPLMAQGLEIDFAHRTFRWDNESFEKAHVHCVIVGFHVGKETPRVAALATAPQLRATQPQNKRSVSVASDNSSGYYVAT